MVKLTESLVYVRTKTSVENVTKLNLWGCDVDCVELCAGMPKLKILSLSVNKVSSLEPLQHCKALEELYIRKNKIESIDELKHLKELPKLRVLWVEENPFTEVMTYRNKIIQMLPQITTLDNKVVSRDYQPEIEDPVQGYEQGSMTCQGPTDSENNDSSVSESDQPDAMYTSVMFPPLNRTKSLMNASMIGSYIFEDPNEPNDAPPGWEDFQIEDPESHQPTPQMFQSYYEGRKPPRGYSTHLWPNSQQRTAPATMTRKRVNIRSQSMSPARLQRTENMLSAVRVLMDELDQEGLRRVIEEAQRRIKKRH